MRTKDTFRVINVEMCIYEGIIVSLIQYFYKCKYETRKVSLDLTKKVLKMSTKVVSVIDLIDSILNEIKTLKFGKSQTNNNNDVKLTTESVLKYVASNTNDSVLNILGNNDEKENKWDCIECGDGNLNFIFIIKGNGSCVVKAAPPYVRLVGPTWPLKPTRILYEIKYTELLLKYSPNNATKIYFKDINKYLFIMEDLTPKKIFRTEVKNAVKYDNIGNHIGNMLANMLFKTSDLSMNIQDTYKLASFFNGNTELIGLTEQVIFEEPYYEASNNRIRLTGDKMLKDNNIKYINAIKKLRENYDITKLIYNLRNKFRNLKQCLCHGDLHTGSLMVSNDKTVAIDAEFSFYGPFAWDIGQFIGNMVRVSYIFVSEYIDIYFVYYLCYILYMYRHWEFLDKNCMKNRRIEVLIKNIYVRK